MSDLTATEMLSFLIFCVRAKKKVIPAPKPKVKVSSELSLIVVIMMTVEMHYF